MATNPHAMLAPSGFFAALLAPRATIDPDRSATISPRTSPPGPTPGTRTRTSFVWPKSAEEILERLAGYCAATNLEATPDTPFRALQPDRTLGTPLLPSSVEADSSSAHKHSETPTTTTAADNRSPRGQYCA